MTVPAETKTVEVPWQVLPGYQCFGCSPSNEQGLRLTFTRNGAGIETRLLLGRAFESYPGVVHGGIATTVCDEIMGNLLVLRVGATVFTTTLRTRYLAPLKIGVEYRCVATTDAGPDTPAPLRARAEILGPDGSQHVTAVADYQPATEEQARRRMAISDSDAALVQQAITAHRIEN